MAEMGPCHAGHSAASRLLVGRQLEVFGQVRKEGLDLQPTGCALTPSKPGLRDTGCAGVSRSEAVTLPLEPLARPGREWKRRSRLCMRVAGLWIRGFSNSLCVQLAA